MSKDNRGLPTNMPPVKGRNRGRNKRSQQMPPPPNPNTGNNDGFDLHAFEESLKGYGNLFYPPQPTAKNPVRIYLLLGVLVAILAGVGVLAFLTRQDVTAVSDSVAMLSSQVAERTEFVIPKVDLSGVEANLRDIATQNDAVLERLTILEAQVGFLSATVGVATQEVGIVQQSFAGTNTPHADISQTQPNTPEPTPTVTLAENEFIIRTETAIFFVPDTQQGIVARFSDETRITALGGFRNINEQVWLVIKPTREMNLILTPNTTESAIYDERPYAFVLYNETVTGELIMTPNVPLQMTLTDTRTLRSAPEIVPTNVIEEPIYIDTTWNVLGVYTHPTTQIEWVVLDLIGSDFDTTDRTRAFILLSITRENESISRPAFGGIDLEILAWMPEYSYIPATENTGAGQSSPQIAPTNIPLTPDVTPPIGGGGDR